MPLTDRVELSRWTMLGHVLRFPENCPAAASLTFAVDGSMAFKSRRGRHQMNLLNTIKCDLNTRNFKLDNIGDLYTLRDIAKDRCTWRNMYDNT